MADFLRTISSKERERERERERVKHWFFTSFDVIVSHTFHENFIKIP